jgi:high affinity cGMP-specific 3',5'-cyclic phosphodiesterase 9
VKQKFLEMCHTTFSDDVKVALRLPSFDSYEYEDYEILHLMEMMFVELNFLEKFHIKPARLREWLYEVYKHYNDVPFHNFRHCFCVSQMVSQPGSASKLSRHFMKERRGRRMRNFSTAVGGV